MRLTISTGERKKEARKHAACQQGPATSPGELALRPSKSVSSSSEPTAQGDVNPTEGVLLTARTDGELDPTDEEIGLREVDEFINANMPGPWDPGALISPNITTLLLGSMPVGPLGTSEDRTGTLRTTINPSALSEGSGSSSSTSESPQSFPDSYLLPVHELSILRAVFRISERINCPLFWDISAESPFFTGVATPADQLPKCLRPTQSQLMVAHHPFIDFLPWPSVREKLLVIFNLEDHLRPPNAAGPLALVNFAYDVEDGAEGLRIWGGDVFDAGCWEVGQTLFERWWFLFDRDVIENSNRWRRLRGAPPLTTNRGISRC
jgi:hypothetical protein